jgi:lipopolysaccharide transport system permease protein
VSNTSRTEILDDGTPVVYIGPGVSILPNFVELWAARELVLFLIWRDIKIRYKQTLIGAGWAVIQPFTTMVVFSIFFGQVVKVPSEDVPYEIFSYTALVPWSLFTSSLGMVSDSIVANAHLIRKVYFPSIILPLSSSLGRLVDFAFSFVILLGIMLAYGFFPGPEALVLIPALLLLLYATVWGFGFWLAALNVRFRDVRQLVPFIIQLWLFATPVIYPSSLLDDRYRIVYGLNPMVSVIEGFRYALVGIESPYPEMFITSIITSLVLLVTGTWFFQRSQSTFVDIV